LNPRKKKKQKDFYSLGITINPAGVGLAAALAQPPKKKLAQVARLFYTLSSRA
jgi:phage terminase large subunit-like protein